MIKTITVVTATYNRSRYIEKLYQSLLKQTNQDFVWLIIDDGSVDDTEEKVKKWSVENKLNIVYKKKKNGGKHTALNFALKCVTTRLVFIVDSDDILPTDAISIILSYDKKYCNEENICGYSFLKCYSDGTINDKVFPQDEMKTSYIESRINGRIAGDKAEVFFADALREFPFPEYENEKFLGEDTVWIKMALKYDMIHINKVIYIADYLEDGLTNNARKLKIESPLGAMERAKMFMNPKCIFSARLKGAFMYVIYGKFAKRSVREIINATPYKRIVLFSFIPGICVYHIWNFMYKRGE